jgi:hypothetical protein
MLVRQPATISQIARPFPVSFNVVSKHMMVLERAGLCTVKSGAESISAACGRAPSAKPMHGSSNIGSSGQHRPRRHRGHFPFVPFVV